MQTNARQNTFPAGQKEEGGTRTGNYWIASRQEMIEIAENWDI